MNPETKKWWDDNNRKADIREQMASKIAEMQQLGSDIYDTWLRLDLEGDFLAEDEFPFNESLDEWIARCSHAVDRIREVNALLRLRPIEMTLDPLDFDALLKALEEPATVRPKLAALLKERADWVD